MAIPNGRDRREKFNKLRVLSDLGGEETKVKANGMAKKRQRTASNQLFNFARDSYLERTSRPVYAIVYLLPFIIFYELEPDAG